MHFTTSVCSPDSIINIVLNLLYCLSVYLYNHSPVFLVAPQVLVITLRASLVVHFYYEVNITFEWHMSNCATRWFLVNEYHWVPQILIKRENVPVTSESPCKSFLTQALFPVTIGRQLLF